MRMYSLMIPEPIIDTMKILSSKTKTSSSELMRIAMREFLGRCLMRGLLTEEDVKDIYFETGEPTDTTYPTFSE